MMESPLEELKRNCVFVVLTEEPMQTLIKLLENLDQRRVTIDTLIFYHNTVGQSKIQLTCLVHKDRVKQIAFQLKRISGVVNVEVLNSNKRIEF